MHTLARVHLEFDEQQLELEIGKRLSVDALYVDCNVHQEAGAQRIRLTIHPKRDLVLHRVELVFKEPFRTGDQIFCNGFQSWSESREYDFEEGIPPLRRLARPYLRYYGDEYLPDVQRGRGRLHSWTYSYLRRGQHLAFIGSLLEATGFTLIQYDRAAQQIRIRKDCRGLQVKHSYPTFDLLLLEGMEQAVFDRYFELLECPPPRAPRVTGWTSWYNYYTDINEALLLENLEALAAAPHDFDIFQIDDGYQTYVGDWLSTKPSFPRGMAPLAQQIRQRGLQPGLWLAPFVCDPRSELYRQHPDWLLRDRSGQPIKVGYNPAWGGWYYALDFYQPGVQEYLTRVFYQVLDQWGYQIVKLDFLFAACIHPPVQKTRGQVMHEVMAFLRRLVGDRWILACGVPLGTCFGMVEYCRIGADIHLQWEHRFLRFLRMRERVSTIVALRTVIGRRQLNGRAFHNDPDVFLLREHNIQLSTPQQYTILLLNTLLGHLLFTSDNLSKYSEEQLLELAEVFHWRNVAVRRVDALGGDRYLIHFKREAQAYVACCNLSGRAAAIQSGALRVTLEAYESLVLRST